MPSSAGRCADQLRLCRLLFAGKMTIEDVDLEPLFADGRWPNRAGCQNWVARANRLAGVLAFSLFANRIRSTGSPTACTWPTSEVGFERQSARTA